MVMMSFNWLNGRSTNYSKLEHKLSRQDEIRESLSLGIKKYHEIEANHTCRELIMPDFESQAILRFPKVGSPYTEPHKMSSFYLQIIAPFVYRFIRGLNFISINKYIKSLMSHPLEPFESSGASGSFFFRSNDGDYIIKSVKSAEARFLRNFLPHYTKHLVDNSNSMLPQFFGLYNYSKYTKKIRFIVMNNILPKFMKFDEIYDLKGSKYKRYANPKLKTTLKDQNFDQKYPYGFFLSKEAYNELIKKLERDVIFLESMNVIDYSLLLGVYKVDEINNFSRDSDLLEFRMGNNYFKNGIVAYTGEMKKVYLFMGVIDVLQSYGIRKIIEKTLKSMIVDAIHLSVNSSSIYGERFMSYLKTIFHPFPEYSFKKMNYRGFGRSQKIFDVNSMVSPTSSNEILISSINTNSVSVQNNYSSMSTAETLVRVTNIDELIKKGDKTSDKASIYSGFIVTTFEKNGNIMTENQL